MNVIESPSWVQHHHPGQLWLQLYKAGGGEAALGVYMSQDIPKPLDGVDVFLPSVHSLGSDNRTQYPSGAQH